MFLARSELDPKKLVVALVVPWICLAVQWEFWPWIKPFVWFLFYPTVFFIAQYSTRIGAILATIESVVLVWFFFLPTQLSWRIENTDNLYSCALFIAMGCLFAETHARIRQMRTSLESSLLKSKEAEAKIGELYKQTLELDELKTQFFANMSHEIRTPLNAILGLSYLVRKNTISPEQTERLDKISVAGTHLLSILNDILDFSKIEAGKMVLEERNFSIHGVLDQVRSMSGEAAQKKNLELKVQYPGVPPWLVGDQTRVRQALLNYVSNAIKFTEHGSVCVRAQLLDARGDRVHIRFEVKDTGVGIPEEKIAQLFKPFKQVDASTTRKYGGTGLGLAITQRLAELMGGQVGVDSELGKGSCFWFTVDFGLGKEQVEEEFNEAEKQLRIQYAGQQILVAEDDAINREVAFSLLTEAGLKVDLAEDGEEAVSLAKVNPYALILMDVQMPVMDGFAATKILRNMASTQSIPIIAFTANVFEDYRRRCLAAGMNDLVAKPVDPKALYASVYKWLTSSVQVNPVLTSQLSAEPRSLDDLVFEQNLRTCLDDLPGLDASLGSANFSGKVLRYFELLKHFVTKKSSEVERWKDLLSEKKIAELLSVIHAFKGSSGSLGLVEPNRLAISIESKLKLSDLAITSDLNQMIDVMKSLKDHLDKINVRSDVHVLPDLDAASDILSTLAKMLETSDFGSVKFYRDSLPGLTASCDKSLVMKLDDAISELDFKKALFITNELIARNVGGL